MTQEINTLGSAHFLLIFRVDVVFHKFLIIDIERPFGELSVFLNKVLLPDRLLRVVHIVEQVDGIVTFAQIGQDGFPSLNLILIIHIPHGQKNPVFIILTDEGGIIAVGMQSALLIVHVQHTFPVFTGAIIFRIKNAFKLHPVFRRHIFYSLLPEIRIPSSSGKL